MNPNEIKERIKSYFHSGKKVFATSSFQTQSLVLLKIISEMNETIPIYFLNTGYHFPETIAFKEKITKELTINVVDLKSSIPKSLQKDTLNRLLYVHDPDHCCSINKVEPLENVLNIYDIWINGVRKSQTENRSIMKYEENTQYKSLRFHPLLDWSDSMVESFIVDNNLPKHPLEKFGYRSIGCEPCTRKLSINNISNFRDERWFGQTKTECGLHTELRTT